MFILTISIFILILLFLGTQFNIFERGFDKKIELNGSYPREYEFENNTFFPETIVQINLGMLHV